MSRPFLAITTLGKPHTWLVQPCLRTSVGRWTYGRSIAGPFHTKREAVDVRRELKPRIVWSRIQWKTSRRSLPFTRVTPKGDE